MIQNFRPASTAKELEVTQMHSQHHSKLVIETGGGQKYRKAACGLTIDSKQLSPCYSTTFHQFIVGSNSDSIIFVMSSVAGIVLKFVFPIA